MTDIYNFFDAWHMFTFISHELFDPEKPVCFWDKDLLDVQK